MEDLAFFLDNFGSTQAVRIKLQEQEKDIKRLEKKVRRLLIGQGMADAAQEEEDRDSGRHSSTNDEEDVSTIMTNLHFFLQTFGSTRAVRQKLESQKQKITGLKRTAQWFQEREGKATTSDKLSNLKSMNAGLLQSEENDTVQVQTEPGLMSATVSTGVETKMQAEDSRKKVETTATGIKMMDKPHPRCSQPGCKETVQVNGLCYHHGGYYTCTFKDCNRRAVTKYLCHVHGGRDRQPGCRKQSVSSDKEFGNAHAREQPCSLKGYKNFQVKRGYCNKHNLENAATKYAKKDILSCNHQAPTTETHPSAPKLHHQTCRAPGCMKWVMRNGDPNIYCIVHRTGSTTESGISGIPATLEARIDPVIVHPTKVTKERDVLSISKPEDRGCKQPGCTNVGSSKGAKKGFCFRHGGGKTCVVEGCVKKQKRNKRCVAHGGYYECKAEGCKKHVYLRGYCKGHLQDDLDVHMPK
ncbi:hypothetical protein DVH05_020179 [Phytophthora capsici]|nr:hypothetical protein DVH05_020179 [Phytophthora capsici]